MIPPRPHQINRGPMPKGGPSRTLSYFKLKGLRHRIIPSLIVAKFQLLAKTKAYWASKQIKLESGFSRPKSTGGVVVVSPYYGSEAMLISFLDYHRSLGVDEFVLLDISEKGGLSDKLADQPDCAVWRPQGKIDASNTLHWLNFLRWHYAMDRWCLSLQPNERFVFFRCETRLIKDLLDFLDSERRDHIYSIIVEMYGDKPAGSIAMQHGENPLALLPYFDPTGYATTDAGPNRNVIVRGGVQRRTLFKNMPRKTPALNRIPLVKWSWPYTYVADTRLLVPRRLNTPHVPWHSSPTACLLSFAHLEDQNALKVAVQAEKGEIISDDCVGKYEGVIALRDVNLKQNFSARYSNSTELVDAGLLNPGQWF